jgi:hypothetical protein
MARRKQYDAFLRSKVLDLIWTLREKTTSHQSRF